MPSDMTDAGEQILIPGVAPIRITTAMLLERFTRLRDDARRSKARSLDIGFWDPMRNQLDLF
jgi:hypothetical protein